MHSEFFNSWRRYVKNLGEVTKAFQQGKSTIFVGFASYSRIIPAIFLGRRDYQIYAVRDSADLDLLRKYATIYCLEEKNKKVAARVQATEYLVRNYMFQGFLKSRDYPYELMFYQATRRIVEFLKEEGIPWIGNHPDSYEYVLHKEGFREVLKSLNFEYLPDWNMSKQEFLSKNFGDLFRRWQKPFVVQPSDYNVIGGTHFIKSEDDLKETQRDFFSDRFIKSNQVKLTPLIEGDSLSMTGCVTDRGVLTGPLQLQLIDVPEFLHGHPATGEFCGNDWGYRSWTTSAEVEAQVATEFLGKSLSERGYKGIFGVDFIYDKKKDRLYALECNPRFVGNIPMFSMTNILNGAPPIEFFTMAAFKNISVDFDPERVSDAWKRTQKVAHIAFTPHGLEEMKLDMQAGVYTYNRKEKQLRYLRPGAFLHELRGPEEFILVDQVPRLGQKIFGGVPRLFRVIFNDTIAESSYKIKPEYGEIVSHISKRLRGEKV